MIYWKMSCKLKVVVHFLTNLTIIISFLLGFLDTFDEVFENEQVCVCLQ